MTGDRAHRAVAALAALGLVAGLSGLCAALLEGHRCSSLPARESAPSTTSTRWAAS
jgi:hypothetical protein